MKSMFHEWRANDGKLSFCAPTFADPPRPKRPRPVTSRMAHAYATPLPSKRQSKSPAPYLAAQYPVFGGGKRAEDFIVGKAAGVKVEGLREMFGL